MLSLRTASRITCTVTLPIASSEVALIVALPGAIPVTKPAASTDAIDGLSDAHLIEAPLRGSPFAVRATAISRSALPATMGRASGSISTVVILDVATLTVAYPVLPAITAPTVTIPGAWNVISPDSSAPARSKGAANQTEGLASIALPAASLAAALNLTFWPTWTSSVLGVISTIAGATDVVISCGLAASCDHAGIEKIA